MSSKNPVVFEGTHFQDILKEIHTHAAAKRGQIKDLMDTLAQMIKTPHEAAIIAPLVKDYLDVAVRNDEHLVKIAAIVQRLIATEINSSGGSSLDSILTDEEKEKLLEEAKEAQTLAREEALDELHKAVVEDAEMNQLAKKAKKALKKVAPQSKSST